MRMQARVKMQDRVMQVLQGCSHLHVVPMSGAVCQRHAPEPTGQVEDNAAITYRGDKEMKEKEAAQSHKEKKTRTRAEG